MWSKNLIYVASRNPFLKIQCGTCVLPSRLFSSQVQEAERPERPVKEYTETPKPPKQRPLKKFREPFPKCFFVGKCDPEVLEYPEVLDLEEIDNIKALAGKVKNVFENEIDSKMIDATSTLPKSAIEKLVGLGVLGSKLPIHYDGLGYTETEAAVISEATALDGSVSKFITEQQNLCGVFLKQYGTEDQKERYLRSLIRGENIMTCAYQEQNSLADTETPIGTVALPDGEGGFEISGTKLWVYNAAVADTFIVFATTTKKEDTGQRVQAMSAFLVNADIPGITVERPISSFALRGVPISTVNFSEVRVSSNAVLGELHRGQLMMTTAMSSKMDIGPLVVGITKRVLDDVTRHVINTIFMGSPLSDSEGVKSRLGRLATVIYTLESAVFLQKGHADLYENADTFLELSINKVLASSTLDFVLREAMQLLGPDVLAKEELQYLNRIVRDSVFHAICDETNINLKVALALNGLQHSGMTVHDEVRKLRNPFMYPAFILRKYFEGEKRYGGSSGNDLGFAGYLHPSLQNQAAILEYCVSRIMMTTEMLLSNYGKEIVDRNMELCSLANMAIATYALTATLGRASRSYCIGLSEAQTELDMAVAVANTTRREVTQLLDHLQEGPILSNINNYTVISDRALANKGSFTETPITRNF